MHYHPWRALRDHDEVVVSWRDDMPATMRGATNGKDIIWMDRHRLQVERRCTIAHELEHIELGDDERQSPKAERLVRRRTALKLIDTAELIDALKWARSLPELADELWVTVDVLQDRLNALSTVERAMILTAIQKD